MFEATANRQIRDRLLAARSARSAQFMNLFRRTRSRRSGPAHFFRRAAA